MSTINTNYGVNTVRTAKADIARPGEGQVQTELFSDQVTLGGTGMACAMVAGQAALLMSEHPEMSVADVKAALIEGGGGTSERAPSIPASVDGANIAGVKPANTKKKVSEDLSLHGVGATSLQGLYSKTPVAQLGFGFMNFD